MTSERERLARRVQAWLTAVSVTANLVGAIVVVVLMVAMRIAWKISGTRQVDLV